MFSVLRLGVSLLSMMMTMDEVGVFFMFGAGETEDRLSVCERPASHVRTNQSASSDSLRVFRPQWALPGCLYVLVGSVVCR